MRGRLVTPRASRSALIVASVPEDTKRTRSIDGTAATTRCASCVSSSVGAPKLVPWRSAARTARSTPGSACPRIIGPHDPT
jgi:hypothetical protein